MDSESPKNGEKVEVSGFLMESQTRKVGNSAHNKIIRFPHKWIDDLTENMGKPFLEVNYLFDPNDGFCIVIKRIKEE